MQGCSAAGPDEQDRGRKWSLAAKEETEVLVDIDTEIRPLVS